MFASVSIEHGRAGRPTPFPASASAPPRHALPLLRPASFLFPSKGTTREGLSPELPHTTHLEPQGRAAPPLAPERGGEPPLCREGSRCLP
uniref:Uncharacterized protein n=1 Tax=Arundo donax TaxID=35708 RepID=A0A0A9BP72_ARUDO